MGVAALWRGGDRPLAVLDAGLVVLSLIRYVREHGQRLGFQFGIPQRSFEQLLSLIELALLD